MLLYIQIHLFMKQEGHHRTNAEKHKKNFTDQVLKTSLDI